METDELADSMLSDFPNKKDTADETVLKRIQELYGSMRGTQRCLPNPTRCLSLRIWSLSEYSLARE